MIWILVGGVPLAFGVGWFLWDLYQWDQLWEFIRDIGALLAVAACILAVCYGIQQVAG